MKHCIQSKDFDISLLNDKDLCFFSTSLSLEDIYSIISNILAYEQSTQKNIHFFLKDLPKNIRRDLLECFLSNYSITNFQILINIVNLIKNYNQFAPDFFDSEFIFINSLEEFLDFKVELKKHLDDYMLELSKWYVSLFKSLHKIETNYLDDVKEMPKSFYTIILNFDFYTLSAILDKSLDFKLSDCYLVENAYTIISTLVNKQQNMSTLLSHILTKC